MTKTAATIDYEPTTWNASQRDMHEVTDLTAALHRATSLAGGWYRRPVSIDMQIVGDEEHYSLKPADVAAPDGWTRVYTLDAHVGER